ncbi:MAG TPA: CoA transferase [Dehalococcoidia bacterium]|nr:CoA transferase [Dehalococcoidia bacterium]
MPSALLDQIMAAAAFAPLNPAPTFSGADPVFPLALRIGEAGAAAIAATGVAAAELWRLRTGRTQSVHVAVDAAAAAMRGNQYLRREQEGGGDAPLAAAGRIPGAGGGIYRTGDGRWIYLHGGFEHHRARIRKLLQCEEDAESMARAVAGWKAAALEDAVFSHGACGGVIRTEAEWLRGEQGQAIAGLPLLEVLRAGDSRPEPLPQAARPLSGIRVLDLTRVLAGPTCARTLAEHGAEVLRVGTDRLPNNESQTIDTGHGKRSTVLDLANPSGIEQLKALIRDADVFSQSYRPGSLASRGFSLDAVMALRPGIIYVTLSAFSHAGPWRDRRGFDTLVQAVSGIADEYALDGRPRLYPVSALDYITGYLAAFGVMVALGRRAREGGSYHVRVSLAQTGRWLTAQGRIAPERVAAAPADLTPERLAALSTTSDSPFGRLRHLAPVVQMSETPARWERPAVPLDHDEPRWLDEERGTRK